VQLMAPAFQRKGLPSFANTTTGAFGQVLDRLTSLLLLALSYAPTYKLIPRAKHPMTLGALASVRVSTSRSCLITDD